MLLRRVSGGIYGNETLAQAAPPGFVIMLLLVAPLFFALPTALITAELSTAIPVSGGFVAWIQASIVTARLRRARE